MIHVTDWLRGLPWVSPARRLEWYPPLRVMRIRVEYLSSDGRKVRIRLPLNAQNRNPGGSMFGGAVAALADPIAALSCNRVFPGNNVWTRAMHLDFRREGRTDLELRFEMDAETEQRARLELASRGRATPSFQYAFYDARDRLCVQVRNTVAIRPLDYRAARAQPSQ